MPALSRHFLLAASLLVPGLTFGHGGGLDSYGCHHNRKQGGYHCHRGPLAGEAFASKDAMLKALKERSAEKPNPKKQ